VHGTTTDNETNIATGWLPGELSGLGRRQATDLGVYLKEQGEHLDIVFSSDLKRAVDSAQLAFGDWGIEIKQDPRVRECNYGEWNGKDLKEKKKAMGECIYQRFPGGESKRDVEKRMRDFCDYLRKNYDGKVVGIMSHRAPQLALEVICNGKTWEQAAREDGAKQRHGNPVGLLY